jgi:glutaredoxin
MIKIYGNDMCKWCLKAKKLAEDYKLSHEWVDLDIDSNLNDFKMLFPDSVTIPQIVWHGRHIGGYESFAEEVENTISTYGQDLI